MSQGIGAPLCGDVTKTNSATAGGAGVARPGSNGGGG